MCSDFDSGNFVGSWLSPEVRAKAIWNFFEAETITMVPRGVEA